MDDKPFTLPKDNESQADLYWSAMENEYIKDMSHWRGVGRWADDEQWLETGKLNVKVYQKLLEEAKFPKDKLSSMIEWGPGGGLNAIHFCKLTEHYYGVDISQPNLDETARQLNANGIDNFSNFHIDVHQPESIKEQIPAPVDFFLCLDVYQHFPSKDYGERITKLAYDLLADEAIALIQIRYTEGEESSFTENYVENAIYFTVYTIEEFWDLAAKAGFTPLTLIHNQDSKQAYYLLKKSKK